MFSDLQGEWGYTADDEDNQFLSRTSNLQSIRESFRSTAKEFRTLFTLFLTDLAYQSDTEMRFLGVRLNFNRAYVTLERDPKKERRKGGNSGARSGEDQFDENKEHLEVPRGPT